MSVTRITPEALDKLISGHVKEKAYCVVKFYSNQCNYCHNLKELYEDLSAKHDEGHFYAFNIADDPEFELRLGFTGVPTFMLMKVDPSTTNINIKILSEPSKPDELTWYAPRAIKKFIEENVSE